MPLVLLAPDKFKGALSSPEIAAILQQELRLLLPPDWRFDCCAVADGGEGFSEVFRTMPGVEQRSTRCVDALGREIRAPYFRRGNWAILEMSMASGLALVANCTPDPWRATTFGTGMMVKDAIEHGTEDILLGIGGSATNDGGIGLAEALGFHFLDARGGRVENPGEHWEIVASISRPRREIWPNVTVACDVENPLLGPNGCTRVYGPQKGVKQEDIAKHEARLKKLVHLAARDLGVAGMDDLPGSGAAGGLGYGLRVFLGAELRAGFEVVSAALDLESRLRRADFVITGEGRLDSQTLHGKTAIGVANEAAKHGIPCLAVCGSLESSTAAALREKFAQIFAISPVDLSIEEAIRSTAQNLRRAAPNIAAALLAAKANA